MVGERGEKSSHHRYVRVISSLSLHLWSPSYFIYAMRPFCSHFISPHTESFMCCRATTGNTAEQQRHRLIKLWSTANRCDTIKWTNLPCDTMKFVDIDGESSWQLWILLFKRFCKTFNSFLVRFSLARWRVYATILVFPSKNGHILAIDVHLQAQQMAHCSRICSEQVTILGISFNLNLIL